MDTLIKEEYNFSFNVEKIAICAGSGTTTFTKGKVKTYKQVAIGIKKPKSARAVANACGKNPYSPQIPCHRVIRSDGGLGGYSGKGGIKTKKKLLKLEGLYF